MDLHRRRQEEYLFNRLSTYKNVGNEEEKSYSTANIQFISSKNNETNKTSLKSHSDKSI